MSPRNSCSVSMVLGCSATTELSSLTASSTMSRWGAFFFTRIAVLKSFFSAGLAELRREGCMHARLDRDLTLWGRAGGGGAQAEARHFSPCDLHHLLPSPNAPPWTAPLSITPTYTYPAASCDGPASAMASLSGWGAGWRWRVYLGLFLLQLGVAGRCGAGRVLSWERGTGDEPLLP